MKAKGRTFGGLILLAVVFVQTTLAQPPTRVYGPVGPQGAQTIRLDHSNNQCYFFLDPGKVEFGDWATEWWLYGFMRWSFSQNTLPPGATITQVELKFNKVQVPYFHYTDHASFTLYDVKLPISDPNALHAALTTPNKILDGTTTTVNNNEVFATSDPALVTVVQSALTSGRNFVTIGVKRIPEQGNGGENWGIWEGIYPYQCTATLQVWFTPPQYGIQFKNDLDGASFGTINVNGQSYNSGSSISHYWGDQPVVTAYTGTYQYGTNDWKFQTWTDGNPNDNQNPRSFTILTTEDVVAFFEPVYDVTIRNDFEGSEGGQLIYQGNQVNTGYTDQDVFRSFTRSFSAITPQTNGGFTFNFDHWSDGVSSLSRNVSVTSTATYQAKYKAHLVSSTSIATASNSQRPVVSMGVNGADDRFHMLYPSVNEIWHTYSIDGGATWDGELRISDGTGTSGAPSVALWTECADNGSPLTDCETDLYGVYRKQYGSDYKIHFSLIEEGVPTSTEIISSTISTGIDTRPVIARVDIDGQWPQLWAFWETSSGIHFNYAYPEGSSWTWNGEMTGYFNGCLRPSISAPDLTVSTPSWYLTYDNGSDVYIVDEPNTVDEVVPASVGPISYASQVSADVSDGVHAHVVWEAYGEEEQSTDGGNSWEGNSSIILQRRVMYQKWDGSNWSSAHEFHSSTPTVHYKRPTVSNLSNWNIVWAWDDGSSTHKAVYDGSSWSLTETYNSTVYPNLAISGSFGPIGSTRFVSTGTSGTPYHLNIGTSTTDPIGQQTATVAERYGRRVVVARKPFHKAVKLHNTRSGDDRRGPDTSAYFSTEVSSMGIKLQDGSLVPVEFAAVQDSNENEQSIWRWLRSTPITLSSTADSIIVAGEVTARTPLGLTATEIGLSFDVVDADLGTVLKRIGSERVYSSNGRSTLSCRERLIGLAGRRVVIRPSVRGFVIGSRSLVSTLVHVHTLLDDATSGSVSSLANVSLSSTVPTVFALHQNYPNPFNPSTEIRFDLPEAGLVSLVVFDVLGRQVADLATGHQEAGYHSATWNASSVASGVYFTRFNVTNAEGKVAYSKINKLVLMK